MAALELFRPSCASPVPSRSHQLAVRWYLRYGLSYRDVEELLTERGIEVGRTFFTTALAPHGEPDEVITDLVQALETVIEELIPDSFHNTEQYANNRVECDHGRLKARLRPMRGLITYAADTTNSEPKLCTRTCESSQRSRSSPKQGTLLVSST